LQTCWFQTNISPFFAPVQLGFVAGASSFIAENLSKAVHDINPNVYISPGMFLVISAVVMAPLVLIRKIAKLSFAAVIADVLIVMGLITLVCSDVMDLLYNNKVEGDTRWLAPGPDVEWIFNRYDYAVFIGTAIYAFEGIGK
jgi:proton-coupled amino acid transporter